MSVCCDSLKQRLPVIMSFSLLRGKKKKEHKPTPRVPAEKEEEEEMKRNFQDGPPEKKLVQTPKELYDELAVRIQNEEDAAKKAECLLQQAKAYLRMKEDDVTKQQEEVRAADLGGDPFKRREARLALFKAEEGEKKTAEWELKKVEGELEAMNASATMKTVWEDQLLEAVMELGKLRKEWPARYEQRKQELEQQIPPLQATLGARRK